MAATPPKQPAEIDVFTRKRIDDILELGYRLVPPERCLPVGQMCLIGSVSRRVYRPTEELMHRVNVHTVTVVYPVGGVADVQMPLSVAVTVGGAGPDARFMSRTAVYSALDNEFSSQQGSTMPASFGPDASQFSSGIAGLHYDIENAYHGGPSAGLPAR